MGCCLSPTAAGSWPSARVLLTRDDQVVFAETSSETSNAGELHLVGGGVDGAHVDGSGYVRLDWCMDAELREEIGLCLDEAPVLAYKLRWLITEAPFGFRFPIYEIRLRLTAEELRSHFDAFTRSLRRQHHLPELQELVAIPRRGTAVDHFLATDRRPRAAYLEALLRTILLP